MRVHQRHYARWLPIAAVLMFSTPITAHAQDRTAQTISTSGSGRFKRCWDLPFNSSCRTHHVRLPERLSVGDTIELDYGSNPKHYRFHIDRIIRAIGGLCVLKGGRVFLEKSEKIEIDNCVTGAAGNDTISDRP
jgi:hypothetical protein